MSSSCIRLILLGFGSVNQDLCRILENKSQQLDSLLNKKQIIIVGVSDSKGAIFNQNGLKISKLLSVKKTKSSVIYYNGDSNCEFFANAMKMLQTESVTHSYDILVDGSPANLEHGNPGLECSLYVLSSTADKKVVTANKAPLVLQFAAFHQSLDYQKRLRYSAAVCGGLPVINVLKHDLIPQISEISEITGLFNSTTNYVLAQLTEHVSDPTMTVSKALKGAQDIGIAETDPSLDINGSDAANKLVIIMNVIGVRVQFSDIERSGLELVNKERISEAVHQRGKIIKMVARAKRTTDNIHNKSKSSRQFGWELSVKCEEIDPNSFLGKTDAADMAITVTSDLFSTIFMRSNEPDVVATSSAVLRDILSLELNDNNYNLVCKL